MAREMLGVVMVLGLLLAMVPNTMQFRVTRPDLNDPFVGLILSTDSDEKLLLDSGSFVRETTVQRAGRTFNIGTFKGVPTVYVIALPPMAHVSATVQIMIDSFAIVGIIDYANSAAVNPSVKFADVTVLSETAFTSVMTWEKYEGERKASTHHELPSLKIGDYNVPKAGENKLGSLQYEKIKKYTPKGQTKETFWYYTDPEWLEIAAELKDMSLESCIRGMCTKDDVPRVKHGVRGTSSDIYVENEAYAKFLHRELDVYTVDQTSSATVSAAVANGVQHIVFRAAANKPGMPNDQDANALASQNNLKVVSKFMELLANRLPMIKYKYI